MDKFKSICKRLLFPHSIIAFSLFPISLIFLLIAMLYFGSTSVISYISYMFAFYSLTIFSLRIPLIIKWFQKIQKKNKYIIRFKEDKRFKIMVTLYCSLIFNLIYSIFQLCLGLYHKSFWFYSMALYYVLLSGMRFYLVSHTRKNNLGEELYIEYKKYNLCGWIMLLMNTAVSAMIFFIIYFGRTFYHHQITTIALATYTFITFSVAIYNFIKYRKYKSPVYSAAKSVSLVSACVSMITLSTTMLTTFGTEEVEEFRTILLTVVGIIVSLFILITSIQIIVFTNINIKKYEKRV